MCKRRSPKTFYPRKLLVRILCYFVLHFVTMEVKLSTFLFEFYFALCVHALILSYAALRPFTLHNNRSSSQYNSLPSTASRQYSAAELHALRNHNKVVLNSDVSDRLKHLGIAKHRGSRRDADTFDDIFPSSSHARVVNHSEESKFPLPENLPSLK